MSTYMSSTNISIRKEAYDFLRSLQDGRKSFSEVILGLKEKQERKGNKEVVLSYFGAVENKKIDLKKTEKNIKDFREEFDNRIKFVKKALLK